MTTRHDDDGPLGSRPGLTPRQRQILAALQEAIEKNGYPPSIRELGRAVGLSSTATVYSHLHHLERKGYIRRAYRQSRSIEVVQAAGSAAGLPVRPVPVLGRVPAGEPRLAGAPWEQEEGIPLPAPPAPQEAFALRVRGDSMLGAGIQEGDYVVVAPNAPVEEGAIVVALLGEEATVKRLRRQGSEPWLVAENPAYPPIPAREARVLGRVVGVYRTV
jgi:repressor LexA